MVGLCAILGAESALAQTTPVTPFVCHGQSVIPYPSGATPGQQQLVNPTTASAGLLGECAGLPYTVPSGYTLVINAMQLEGVFGSSLILYANGAKGAPPTFSAMPTLSTGATADYNWNASPVPSNQFTNLNWQFPAGSLIQMYLSSNVPSAGVAVGWGISGYLVAQ